MGRRIFLQSAAAAIWFGRARSLSSQTISQLLAKSKCRLPVYFPVEVWNAGRIVKDGSWFKVQVNNCATIQGRRDFMAKAGAEKERLFDSLEPVHEFITRGEGPFGAAPTDSYKGLEQYRGEYMFKFLGSGEKLKQIRVTYRSIPAHGQVTKREVDAVEYFNRIMEASIKPALARC